MIFQKFDGVLYVNFENWSHKKSLKFCNFKMQLWWDSSSSEPFRLPEWWVENIASGQGSLKERSPMGSRFSESLFLDVPGSATEQVRTCGFKKNSSSLDKTPKKRDSVRLNSFESFSVTLPSISSKTWEIYSWAISEVKCVLWLTVPCIFRFFSRSCR